MLTQIKKNISPIKQEKSSVNSNKTLLPTHVIIYGIVPFLLSKKGQCIKDNSHGSEIIFANKEIYKYIKIYLPKNCAKDKVQFFNKTFCPYHEENSAAIAKSFLKFRMKKKNFHPDPDNKLISEMISRNTLRPNLEMMIQGTPLNIIRECCSGTGFRVSINGEKLFRHKKRMTNTYKGRKPRRGNLIIHQRWSVAGDWDIYSYMKPIVRIPDCPREVDEVTPPYVKLKLTPHYMKLKLTDVQLPDTIVKTRCVEKEIKEEMLKIRTKRKRITKLLIERQKARDRQKKRKEKSHAKKNKRKISQRHR